jgi:hypothetical protein
MKRIGAMKKRGLCEIGRLLGKSWILNIHSGEQRIKWDLRQMRRLWGKRVTLIPGEFHFMMARGGRPCFVRISGWMRGKKS